MADNPRIRSLIHLPDAMVLGVAFEVRATLGHPMETGFRPDAVGQLLPRNIVTRFECRLDEAMVCSVDLYPAIAANPYIAFWVRADAPGTLHFEWLGDDGFAHRETRAITPT